MNAEAATSDPADELALEPIDWSSVRRWILSGLAVIAIALCVSLWDGPFPQRKVGSIGEWLGAAATTAAIVLGWRQLAIERKATRLERASTQALLRIETERWEDAKRSHVLAFRANDVLILRNTGRRTATKIRVEAAENSSLKLLETYFPTLPAEAEIEMGRFLAKGDSFLPITVTWLDEDGTERTNVCPARV